MKLVKKSKKLEKAKINRVVSPITTKKEINWAEYLDFTLFMERQGVDTILLLRFEEGFKT